MLVPEHLPGKVTHDQTCEGSGRRPHGIVHLQPRLRGWARPGGKAAAPTPLGQHLRGSTHKGKRPPKIGTTPAREGAPLLRPEALQALAWGQQPFPRESTCPLPKSRELGGIWRASNSGMNKDSSFSAGSRLTARPGPAPAFENLMFPVQWALSVSIQRMQESESCLSTSPQE